jgi:DnaJ-class molecular chaperone
MKDPYETLGVEHSATEADIRKAYRKLAKLHHPDLNPGKAQAEERFKAISAAYALLSDPEQRGRFDRGEIDASGAEKPAARQFYRDFADAAGSDKYRPEAAFDPDDLANIFGQAFDRRGGRGFASRGADAHYALSVDFMAAANGAVRRLTLPDGRTLDVTIPAGLQNGQVLRLQGQGMPGFGEGPPGDALIEVEVLPHPLFRRQGNDVLLEVPVTLKEAVLGAKIEVPTIKGPVSLTIPANATSGTRLRLKGRGFAGGHQYVDLKVMLPTQAEPELAAFLESWTPQHPFEPRKAMVQT